MAAPRDLSGTRGLVLTVALWLAAHAVLAATVIAVRQGRVTFVLPAVPARAAP